MNNPYFLEKMMIEHEREINERLAHETLVSQLHATPRISGGHRLPVRARFGLFLIRLGTSLSA